MPDQDSFSCEILADGTIRSVTDPISAPNHSSCDRFFKLMQELAGGPQERARRSAKHVHEHNHSHEEQHS